MTSIVGEKVVSISSESLTTTDNKSIVLKYEDGSIQYFATGSKDMEVHFDNKTIVMDDYKSLKGYGVKVAEITTNISEKGQFEALYETLSGETTNWPIEL